MDKHCLFLKEMEFVNSSILVFVFYGWALSGVSLTWEDRWERREFCFNNVIQILKLFPSYVTKSIEWYIIKDYFYGLSLNNHFNNLSLKLIFNDLSVNSVIRTSFRLLKAMNWKPPALQNDVIT